MQGFHIHSMDFIYELSIKLPCSYGIYDSVIHTPCPCVFLV